MVDQTLTTDSENATVAAGRALAPLLRRGDVLLLSGDLGAGKTCMTRGIAEGLGVVHAVTSPTFNILIVHRGRIPLHHFDLYRLESASQLEDIDYWGTLEADGVSIVEWGDRFPEAIPEDCLTVAIAIADDDSRRLRMTPRGSRSAELARGWIASCQGVHGVAVEGVTGP